MKYFAIALVIVLLLLAGYAGFYRSVVNEGVAEELRDNPTGERARKVMLLTFFDGDNSDKKTIPVNYLQEGDLVFVGADGPWWRAFSGNGAEVSMLIRGVTTVGVARVELDNQAYIDEIFARLRPTVPEWLPDWLNGRLIVITVDSSGSDANGL